MATKKLDVYKCKMCGNIVEVLHEAGGELICCGQPMTKQLENTQEAATEKHVPVIAKSEDGYTVTVGSVNHPMEDAHHIEWIELIAGEEIYIKFLKPGEQPVAEFKTKATPVSARAFCNLHGFWKSA